jgi:cytochrome bd-type quinol oxidase subunit 2
MLLAVVLELTHWQAMTLFSFFTSLVFAFLTKHDNRERAKYFLWTFALFMLVGLGLGWLMYPFPR